MVSGTERDAKTALASSVERFADRAIGPRPAEQRAMLEALGLSDLDALVESVVPRDIRLPRPLQLPPPRSEQEALTAVRALAAQNQVFRSFIGQGYHDCVLPPVIQRLVLENPGWYTPYTPYQAEIAQGRLEALLHFQTLIIELTGLEVANASLLDEATAAAEALHVCEAIHPGRPRFLVSAACHPQTIEVVQTRAAARGLEVVVDDHRRFVFDASVCGALVQYPDTFGVIHDFRPLAEQAHAADALLVVAADLLALTCLLPPGEFGADIAVGSAQRFGIPMAYGGPHAAFFAARDRFKRNLPGRIVGVSRDARGRPAFRLALQTREQHIRREKATSNICTAQALLASMAAFYAMYHGPDGLRRIARRVHELTRLLAAGLERLGYHGRRADQSAASADSTKWPACFDTLTVDLGRKSAAEIVSVARAHRMNFRVVDEHTLGVALNETTTEADVAEIWQVFNNDRPVTFTVAEVRTALDATGGPFPPLPERRSAFLSEPAFQRYHSETEMMRYLKRLESRDLSLTGSMVPLGSCTMKLNPAAAMLPIAWPEFARMHPFAPLEQAAGYTALIRQLEAWLAEITGFAAVSVQPNAGSQGEFAGLLAIRAYHRSRGEGHRTVCLIPTSAHGTNPASAVLAGLQVVPVACDAHGNVDLADLRAKAATHQRELACLMVTYPSTHGVFEPAIREICEIIHAHGGQVYMDGANLNAQVGLTSPAQCGADVCHLNLHKTFAIPHGGGGPGVGPVGVAAHLVDFLPGHRWLSAQTGRAPGPVGAVSAAPWGSAGILPISWMYIAMMGAEGLTRASQVAILNANYVAKRLANYFPTLYRGPGGWVAHECILDLRRIRRAGTPGGGEDGELLPVKLVTVEDVAKRLMDYGFHAPTVSWPVAGTMMVEPTESESRAELDRFCEAMIRIHAEMVAVETGLADRLDNPLKHAPHTADQVAADNWPHAYSREQAAFPVPTLREAKFWPAVARIDNVYGDRHLVCSCAGMEAFLAEPASPDRGAVAPGCPAAA